MTEIEHIETPGGLELLEIVEPGIGRVRTASGKIQYRYLPNNPQGKQRWALAKLPPELAANQPRTPEEKQAFSQMGREARERKKGEAIVRMARERGLAANTPLEVYAEAVAQLTDELFNKDHKLKDRVDAYVKLGRDVGVVEQVVRQQATDGVIAIQINVSPELIGQYGGDPVEIIDG